MSILIPFSLPLKVGGINDSMAKLTVRPDAAWPSSVTLNTLLVSVADRVGFKVNLICFHVVCELLIVVVP